MRNRSEIEAEIQAAVGTADEETGTRLLAELAIEYLLDVRDLLIQIAGNVVDVETAVEKAGKDVVRALP